MLTDGHGTEKMGRILIPTVLQGMHCIYGGRYIGAIR